MRKPPKSEHSVLTNERWLFLVWFAFSILGTNVGLATEEVSIATVPSVSNGDDMGNRSGFDFRNDVLPIITKLGCNAGACHGAAIGRGGFKLSLYGGNPEADYDAIVREHGGRRVNPVQPSESLIYRKPTDDVAHDGGMVLDPDSDAAAIVLNWLEQGLKFGRKSQVERLEISPSQHISHSLGQPVRLAATAHFTDGTSQDVTKWTIFTADDKSAVQINEDSAEASVLRTGRHLVVARYSTLVVPVEFLAPKFDGESAYPSTNDETNFIDQHVDQRLSVLGYQSSGQADDGDFLRRVSLDLTGRLPNVDKVRTFLESKVPNKQSNLVDELLSSKEFNEHWTSQLAHWLRAGSQQQDQEARQTYLKWIGEQVRRDTSFKEIAWDLITASGDTHQVGPANFYRTTKGPAEQAEFFSEFFMGSRLRCANCHNHPLDRWTQDDYHGLASIFSKVELGQVISIKPSGRVIHPVTLEAAAAKIPGEVDLPKDGDLRIGLASWLTDSENPYLARVFVNRLWSHMMGQGLVEPVDDFRATNPATHPNLLNRLAEDFVSHDYSLRHTLKRIALSNVYARSSQTNGLSKDDDRFYSFARRRDLPDRLYKTAVAQVLDVDVQGNEGLGGRIDGLPGKLNLFNGSILNDRISDPKSRLGQLVESSTPPIEIIKEFYLAALCRNPSDKETDYWKSILKSSPNEVAILEDFVWGLLASREFSTNH